MPAQITQVGCVDGYAVGTYDGGRGSNSYAAYFIAQGDKWLAVGYGCGGEPHIVPGTAGVGDIPSEVKVQLYDKLSIKPLSNC
jgi:hypothetical protein